MTDDVDQSADVTKPVNTTHAALQEMGIAPGRNGYDMTTLAAAVYEQNWSYGIDLETGSYVAIIRTEQADQAASSHQRGNRVRHGLITAYGDTPEDALGAALVQARGQTAKA